jgi:subtilisin family serine protease
VPSVDEAGWQGVLGVRAAVSTAHRYVVLLRSASLASRVRAAGGVATDAEMRSWTASALAVQDQFLARMAAAGVRAAPEHRYVRVLNGFSARLDPTSLSLLERDREVAGVYPVRIAYPAVDGTAAGGAPAAVEGLALPGFDGSGVTVALLDTGVDPSHPYLRDSVLTGIDVIRPGSGGIAQPNPLVPGRPERHGTELAGIVTGSDGPDGLHGVAPGASILPVRVAGWQPDAEGGYAVYSRTDQILAGLEAAVDPDDDGVAHDAARIALIGVVEPYAAFPDGPLARAIAGAGVLDMLVVVPAGNDGRAGPTFGSVAGPGGSPAALTVAASDGRSATPTVRLLVRAGLRVLFEGSVPLGGAPTHTVTAGAVIVSRAAAEQGISGFFQDGVSTVAGRAILLGRGTLSEETVEEATTAGALAVLAEGPLPAGAFSLDVPQGVPVVGLPAEITASVRALLAAGIPVTVSIGSVGEARSVGDPTAAFSSHGLGFGGTFKPDLVAPGVAVPTAEPGRGAEGEVRFGTVSGTSVAAAVAAGAAAVLAEARPRAGAAGLLGLLVGSARRIDADPTAAGTGRVDLRAAVQQEVVAEPAAISFGAAARSPLGIERSVRIHNLASRRLTVALSSYGGLAAGVRITIEPDRVRVGPGRTAEVVVRADTRNAAEDLGAVLGELVLGAPESPAVRVPWAVALPRAVRLLSRVSLEPTGDRATDATPAVLSLLAGAVIASPGPEVRPVDVLEVQLWRGSRFLGVLARRRELLPGRYTFGLTGRGPDGERLRSRNYLVRVVARPGDGTRRQAVVVPYRVR